MTFQVKFVLASPQDAQNVGAAARALKNFGQRSWAVVRPEYEDEAPAQRLAVHAEDWLALAERPATLDDALADCAWIVGTSSRAVRGRRRLRPRAFAEEASERLASGNVALLFGGESSGLPARVLDRCHDLATIPTDPAQPSVNLAQAVLLFAYELRLAAESPGAPPKLPLAATEAERRHLERTLGEALSASGFLHGEPRHALRDLLRPLERARVTRDEARLWTAALHALGKAIDR